MLPLLTTNSTHFIYGYMALDIWLRTILIVRKETRCRHIDYSYRLTARVLLYAPSHRQDNTYHSLCYTSHGALAGTRNNEGRKIMAQHIQLMSVMIESLVFPNWNIRKYMRLLASLHLRITPDIIFKILLLKHLITQILCQ